MPGLGGPLGQHPIRAHSEGSTHLTGWAAPLQMGDGRNPGTLDQPCTGIVTPNLKARGW